MLEDTMFDHTLGSSWNDRSRRGLTTLTSLGIQALAVAVLLLLPLLRPQGLPSFHQLSTPVSLGQPSTEPAPAGTRAGAGSAAPHASVDVLLRMPSRIPKGIPAAGDDPPQLESLGSAIPGTPNGNSSGVAHLFEGGSRPVLPAERPRTVVAPLRISHISEGNLIRRVQPAYPALARSARIHGVVVLQAVISRQGTIENLKVVSGHPMLLPAAVDAVRQWRYRPYILNNEPVEVETQITVNFSLAGN
jgi:protein TonB